VIEVQLASAGSPRRARIERSKRGDDIVNAHKFNDNVNVFVFASLPAEERVNAPTAIEPGPKADGEQSIEHINHVLASHPIVIPPERPRTRVPEPRNPGAPDRRLGGVRAGCRVDSVRAGSARNRPSRGWLCRTSFPYRRFEVLEWDEGRSPGCKIRASPLSSN
jgi:hypothetical protein